MKFRWMVPIVVVAAVALSGRAGAQALSAYIDYSRGVIIGTGKARGGSADSAASLRVKAIEDARKNITLNLERQSLSSEETIGQFLSAHPEKRLAFQSFIESAAVINESAGGDGAVTVTLSLPISGDRGLSALKDWFLGKRESAPSYLFSQPLASAAPSPEEIRDELKGTTEPKKIAMFAFENKSDFTAFDLGAEFTIRLKDRFRRDRRFVILSTDESNQVVRQSRLSYDQLVTAGVNDTVDMKGVDGAALGIIVRYKARTNKHGVGNAGYLEVNVEMELDLRVLNAVTGKWVVYENIPVKLTDRTITLKSADDAEKFIEINNLDSERGLAAKTFRALLDKVEAVIRGAFPVEGYVLKVMGDRVYINLTRSDGVKEDSILTVIRLGDILVDPITGKKIDQIRDRIGTVRVVDVKDTYSQAVIEEILQPVQEGDLVSFR